MNFQDLQTERINRASALVQSLPTRDKIRSLSMPDLIQLAEAVANPFCSSSELFALKRAGLIELILTNLSDAQFNELKTLQG